MPWRLSTARRKAARSTKKFGAYIADVMPAIQEEMALAVEEIHKEVP